ncbi:MAG TPA: hypothetical protein VHC97_12050 [Thermoanaerobaculia bacterium]|nr:hypothetical protein [Thermoanaerobaculia bacterium]
MKTEVYSWRLSPHLKMALEDAARAENKSLAELLEQIARDWLARAKGQSDDEEELQRRLHESAMRFVGSIEADPHLAENSRSEVRARIARRHGR